MIEVLYGDGLPALEARSTAGDLIEAFAFPRPSDPGLSYTYTDEIQTRRRAATFEEIDRLRGIRVRARWGYTVADHALIDRLNSFRLRNAGQRLWFVPRSTADATETISGGIGAPYAFPCRLSGDLSADALTGFQGYALEIEVESRGPQLEVGFYVSPLLAFSAALAANLTDIDLTWETDSDADAGVLIVASQTQADVTGFTPSRAATYTAGDALTGGLVVAVAGGAAGVGAATWTPPSFGTWYLAGWARRVGG